MRWSVWSSQNHGWHIASALRMFVAVTPRPEWKKSHNGMETLLAPPFPHPPKKKKKANRGIRPWRKPWNNQKLTVTIPSASLCPAAADSDLVFWSMQATATRTLTFSTSRYLKPILLLRCAWRRWTPSLCSHWRLRFVLNSCSWSEPCWNSFFAYLSWTSKNFLRCNFTAATVFAPVRKPLILKFP